MPLTMMSSREEEALRFFQYVEDSGLKAYGGVATRNLVWNEESKIVPEKNDKKRKQEEVAKRTSEEVAVEGKHLRMGSANMSEQQQFSVRSQSLNSVGGLEEEEGSPNSRKQPPPKPRRDPSTKLSTSSEAVDHSATTCKGGHSQKGDATQGCSEECRRVPPPKPKRNPNTQLSTSFDESYILNSKDSPPMALSPISPVSPPQPQSPPQDSEEPVYIEMSGNAVRDTSSRSEPEEEPGEAVYEEMKYPAFDDFDTRWDLTGYRSQNITPCPSDMDIHASINYTPTPRSASYCDIPAPFPNLLSHRPPLLVFPPVPAQCSPNSDESPLTPVDVNKLAMLENAAYSKSPSTSSSSMEPLSSASSSHLRRAERELTATPTITVSGRSSAPPLPCALYRGSSSSAGVQRSHSACPSPVSMGRCLTPLSLMRGPSIEGSFSGGALPRHHSSTQNVAAARSRTPTSPLDELTNLFTSGRNMLKKSSSSRKSKEPSESEAKGKVHGSESKRENKEKSHKESKKDKERSGKSSHRRESKDREPCGIEALQRRDSKERTGSNSEPIVKHDSKDRGSNVEPVPRRNSKEKGGNGEPVPRRNSKDRGSKVEPVLRRNSKDRGSNVEPLPRRNSKDRGSNLELLPRRNSKDKGISVEPVIRCNSKDKVCSGPELLPKQGSRDRGCSTTEPIVRHDSKDRISNNIEPLPTRDSRDRICNGSELMLRQDSRDFQRNGLEQHDSRDRICYGPDLLIRHSGKDQGRTGLEGRRNSKEKRKYSNSNVADSGWDCMERMSNGTDVANRRDYKEKGIYITEHHHKSKDKISYGTESPKAHDWDARSGPSPSFSSRSRRSPVSPTTMMGNSEFKMIPKVAQFLSTPLAPSALGTPQRRPSEAQELPMPPFPWLCGDSTMMETIERKQRLCREIRTRQRPPEQSQMECMPSCKKANGQKKYGPPPYPSQTTVFWDTAI